MEHYDEENYAAPANPKATSVPAPNPTLNLLVGNTDSGLYGPAYVAKQQADAFRRESLQLWRDVANSQAGVGNTFAVEYAAREMQRLGSGQPTSYTDDVEEIASNQLEKLIALVQFKGEMGREDAIKNIQLYSRNAAVRSALEASLISLPQRGSGTQLLQDLTGYTTAVEWGRLSPVINEALAPFGGGASLTTVGSAEEFYKVLSNLEQDDAVKVISTLTDRLVDAKLIPLETSRKFFETVINLTEQSKALEGVFGVLDVAGIGLLLKGAAKGVLKASRGVVTARAVGADSLISKDVAKALEGMKSDFGIDATTAVRMSLNADNEQMLSGLSSSVQKELRARLEGMKKAIDESLSTGGATRAELEASARAYERTYSRPNNPAIIESKVVVRDEKGDVFIDALYGKRDGTVFATAEDAREYWSKHLAGDLEVVRLGGEFDSARIAELDAKFDKLFLQYNDTVESVGADTPNVLVRRTTKELAAKWWGNKWGDEFARLESEIGKDVVVKKVKDVREKIYAKFNDFEKAVVKPLIDALDDNFEIWWTKKGSGDIDMRSRHELTSKRIVLDGPRSLDPTVVAHELIHASTAAKLRAVERGIAKPELVRTVEQLDELRKYLQSQLHTIDDPALRGFATYLTKNLDEFSTMAMWRWGKDDKAMTDWMNGLTYKGKSFLTTLWDTVKKLLGLNEGTALSEWVKLTEALGRESVRVSYDDGTEIVTRGAFGPTAESLDKELSDVIAERVAISVGPPRPGYAIRQKVDMPVRLEDLGRMSQEELDSLSLGVGRLNPRLATATTLYKDTLVASLKKSKLAKEWAGFVSTSFDKLNGKSMEKVVDALEQTQKLKREMTEAELYAMASITTDAEKEAYYAYRLMRNSLWQAKNEAARRDLTARGYRQVFSGLGELGEFSGPAKLLEDWRSLIGKSVLDAEKNMFVTLNEKNIYEMQARGLSLYDFKQAQEVPGKKAHATKVALPQSKTTVGDIKSTVGRVDGAYSRIYEEEYFIKMHGNIVVDNEVVYSKYAFRTAASEYDAAKYAAGLNSLIAKGKAVTLDDITKTLGAYEENAEEMLRLLQDGKFQGFTAKINYTRMDDNFFRDVTGVGGADVTDGKLFWSKRSEEGIKSITVGSNDSVIAGPLNSLEREIGNTAMFTAMEEWRRNVVQRWFNEFEDVISQADKLMTKTPEDVFFNVVNRAKEYSLSDSRTNAMMAQARFIVNQLNVRTLDEKLLQHYIRKASTLFDDVADSRIGKMIPAMSHIGPWVRRTDLPEFMKSVASNMMLGFWNLSQLFVQMASSANAVLVSPKHGLVASYMARPILAAIHASDNGAVWRGLHKAMDVVQYTGVSKEEFARIAVALKKTGLVDDVAGSHLFAADTGVQHVFSKNMRKFKDSSWSFFTKAEETNRVISFDIARREWIEANPGKLWDSEEALKAIMLRADDLTTNMMRVNEARYAKGFGGLPLQFLQHSIRFGTTFYAGAKTLINGGKVQTLTAREAIQLFLGSTMLYGINNAGTPDFIEDYIGAASADWDNDTKLLIGEGMFAYAVDAIHELFTGEGAELAFGKRMSSLQWYEDVVDGIHTMFADQTIELEKFTGPSGSAIQNLWKAAGLGVAFVKEEDKTVQGMLITLNEMGATLASSWNNATKAWYASQLDNTLTNKRGDSTARLTNPELIWQAIGISSIEAQESSYVFTNNKNHQRVIKDLTDSLITLQQRQRRLYAAGDVAEAYRVDKAIHLLLEPLSPSDKKAVILGAAPRAAGADTSIGEAMQKWHAQGREQTRILIGSEGTQ